MRLVRWFLGIAGLAVLASAISWYVWRPVSVAVISPSRGDAAEIVYASGVVEPKTWAKVAPVVRERIVEQCNCEGSRVARGDVLARLDDSEARAVLGELEARLRLAQEEYRRLSVLAEKNAASQQQVDRAQSELLQVEALIAGQKARLETYILRAPTPGNVLRQDGEVGEVAELGTVLFWVGEPKPLIVVAEVNEEDIPRVEVGQRALLKADAFSGQILEAEVTSITPKGDPVTKTYRVRFRLPDDSPLMIGMSTEVNIIIRVSKNALLIPSVAVERNQVFVVEGDHARRREIRTGIRGTNGVEALSGLSATDRVISPYPAELADGARVTLASARESEAKMPLILDIAVTHIAGRGRQTVVAVLGVAVGVGFSIAMAALMQGGQEDFIRQLVDTMPHVHITDEQRTARRQPAEVAFATAAISGLRPRDDRRGIINPTAAIAWLESWVPGRFAASLKTQGVMRYSSREVGTAIIGVDPEREPGISPIVDDFVEGSFAALASGGNNVLVGDTMAGRLGAGFGDTITAVSSEGLTRNFKIAGLFHTGTTARDEGEAYVLLKNAQILSARPNAINEIGIKLDDPNRAPTVARRAEAELGYKAVAWQEANESILEALVVRNVIMYTVVGAIMLVAGFGIYNIISTITHEKARDIAIMKSLGFPASDMRRLFLLEGLAIGAGGSALGWLLAFAITYALSLVRFEIAATGQEMTRLPIAWSVLHYAVASAFALGSAAVAGYLPARRAAALNPVDIIRGAT